MKRKNNTTHMIDTVYCAISYIVPILLSVLILIPFLNVLAKSFSSSTHIMSGKVTFWPIGFDTTAYKYIIESGVFFNALKNSGFIVVVGTFLSILVTALVAYPLSKPSLKGRRVFMLLYMFTMVFTAGIIPDYLIVKKIGLIDSIWSMIIPGLVWTYNMLILKSFFEGIPNAIEEAAKIDGAGQFRIFFQIVLPLSKPALATVSLFYAVSYWNDYYKALLYINKIDVKPLPLYMYELVTQSTNLMDSSGMGMESLLSPEGVRCGSIVLSIIPMLIIYPFIQKYFTSGVTLGAVKE